MPIKHGTYVREEATTVTVPKTGKSSVQVVVGCAPINMVANPGSKVNVPILANSAAEAMKELGYVNDVKNFTLCQTMYLSANAFAVGPVVYINVLDPAKHKSAIETKTAQVNDKQAEIPEVGVIASSLSVKGTGDSAGVLNTDYTVSFDANNGHAIITLIDGGALAGATTLTFTGDKLDPKKVNDEDIIGAVDSATGKETGIQAIRQVFPKLGIVPGLLLAPGYSQSAAVGGALSAKAAQLNGVYKSFALLDIDTKQARVYTDTKKVKENSGFTSEFSASFWPCSKIGDLVFAKSAVAGCLIEYIDSNADDVPYQSPSNHPMGTTGECLDDGTEVLLDQDQANTVNGYGIVTAINQNGWRLWGNYTNAYPVSDDAKDIWIAVRRMFTWQENTFINTYFAKVDKPMNKKLIQNIVDSENIRCNSYAPDYWAGASIEYLDDDNPITDILAGKMTFRHHIAPYTPAQDIEDIVNYDIDTLQSALQG